MNRPILTFPLLYIFVLVMLINCKDTNTIMTIPTPTSQLKTAVLAISDSASNTPLPEHLPIRTLSGNSERITDDLENGDVDAILTHRPSSQYWSSPIGVDGLVFVTHPDDGIDEVSITDLQRIFQGDGKTMVWMREAESAEHATFQERVMGGLRIDPDAQVVYSSQKMIEQLETHPNSIGIMTYSAWTQAPHLPLLKVEEIQPTPATLASQEYPLALPLYWQSDEEPSGTERLLLSWFQNEGQSVIGTLFGRVDQ